MSEVTVRLGNSVQMFYEATSGKTVRAGLIVTLPRTAVVENWIKSGHLIEVEAQIEPKETPKKSK